MNTALRGQLAKAYQYYQYEQQHFFAKIDEHRETINNCKILFSREPQPKPPAQQLKEQNTKDNLLCLFLWPVGLKNKMDHKKNSAEIERQANERYVAEMQNYIAFCDVIISKIKEANGHIQVLEARRKEFAKANAELYNFLPYRYQSLWYVSMLYEYVNNGRADSLKEAINLMHEDIEREHDRQLQKANFEKLMAQRQRHHEETMASIDEVKRKQDETTNECREINSRLDSIHNRLFY